MTTDVELSVGSYTIGRLEFLRPPTLDAWRTLTGLAFVIPARVVLDGHDKLRSDRKTPVVSNLRAILRYKGDEVATARDDFIYRTDGQNDARLVAHIPTATVYSLERLRDGGPIQFILTVGGEVCLVQGHSVGHMNRFDPDPIMGRDNTACRVKVEYDASAWSDMLARTGFGENIVVEIPLPPDPGPPWDAVWKALRGARDLLLRGGASAWKLVIAECRLALEEWEKIESVDHGDGGVTANREQREARTPGQRRDALRWHAHQLAHYFQHNHVDECTRDDAVLVLATVVGALAASWRSNSPRGMKDIPRT